MKTLLNWEFCRGLQSEVRDGLPLDGVLMVVQGEDNMGDMFELLDQDVCGEEIVPEEEYKFQERAELNRPTMDYALGQ